MSYKEILFLFVPKLDTYKCVYCTRCKHSDCKTIKGINNLYCKKFKHLVKTSADREDFPSYHWHQACICYKDKYNK